MSNIFAFCELGYLFFLPPKLKNPEKFTKISLISIILSAIFLFLSSASTLFLFSKNFSNSELLPLYISVRCIEFGTFFQRLDAVFLFLCILCFICVLCLNMYLVIEILKNITSTSETKPLMFPYILIILGVSLCYKMNSTLKFLETTVSKIAFISAIGLAFIILLVGNLKKQFEK